MKHAKRFGSLLLAGVLALLFATGASAISVVEQTEGFYVADYANVLSEETEQAILETGDALRSAAGAEFVVVTVDFLNGADINDYAYALFNEWKLGDAERNNGLLLLLAIGEDDYYVMQGEGLERALSSGRLGTLLDDYLEPSFAAGNYDAAVKAFYGAVIGEFEDIYHISLNGQQSGAAQPDQQGLPTPPQKKTAKKTIRLYLLLLAFAVIVVILLHRRGRARRPAKTAPAYRRQWKGYGPPPPAGWTWGGYVQDYPSHPYRPYRPSGFGSSVPRPGGSHSSHAGSFSSGSARPGSSHGSSRPSGPIGRTGGGGRTRGGGVGRRR